MPDEANLQRKEPVEPQPEIKALVLDDSSFDRHRIRRLAGQMPLDVDFCEVSSIETLEDMLDRQKFDVVLLDYHLPSGNGLEALRKLRSHLVNSSCPAIMLTGHDTSELAVRSIKNGCSDYLSKDRLTSQTLAECIVSALQTPEMAETGAVQTVDREGVLAGAMRKYVEAIEPKIARAVQGVRAARRTGTGNETALGDHLNGIEQQCLRIWSVLVDPRTVAGVGDKRN